MIREEEENVRGTTRILMGLILLLGTIAEIITNFSHYSLVGFLGAGAIILIGIIFVIWGWIALQNGLKGFDHEI